MESVIANSSFEAATFTGFYRCFNFISGKNSEDMKIEMTGPVHIKPVPQANGYSVGFFVPSRSVQQKPSLIIDFEPQFADNLCRSCAHHIP